MANTRTQLCVVGAGSGGFGAALSAARLGVSVLLVERADTLGGASVRGGVHCWEMGAGGTGIPFDLYRRLKQIPNAIGIYSYGRHCLWYRPECEPYPFPGGEQVLDPTRRYLDTLQRHGTRGLAKDETLCRERFHGLPFEPECMARVMADMLEETGNCTVLLNTALVHVQSEGSHIEATELNNGDTVRADAYVDSTGDAVLCAAASCEELVGQESRDRFGEPDAPAQANRRINGVTLIYRVTRTCEPNVEPLPAGVPAECWWAREFPPASINHYPCGDLNVNMLPTMEGEEYLRLGETAAYDECARRLRSHWHFLQENYDEFRHFRLSWIAPALGVRESRRIMGEYVLTENDLLEGISRQTHPDTICIADHSMDTHGHSAHRAGCGELQEPYGVPYRCLIPKGFDNLLVACRAASFSSIAASSCRLSRTMMQLGQAAGTAVALVKELGMPLPEVPAQALRQALRQQHAQVDWPMAPDLRRHLSEE